MRKEGNGVGGGVGVTGGGEGLGWKGSCEQEWDELGVGGA